METENNSPEKPLTDVFEISPTKSDFIPPFDNPEYDYLCPFEAFQVADFIEEKLMKRVFYRTFSKEVDSKLQKYTLCDAFNTFEAINKSQSIKRDEGEQNINELSKGHNWESLKEPVFFNKTRSVFNF